ncbi:MULTISPECIES: HigA family addiction module antitoxin [Desulfotignum]|jgi:addiction module HigA family antidote|uniref:Plasmid maintenance system antidote protein, XRE family n=2 Tax=Desulfotignum TaxID=115780 RepID=S0FUS3_9BACT|nr:MULTISPECIES: HigA family addiction module antitoxin [Desulfotignum]EMS78843.1 plasmid maintenance system antidote protein, XRE family [Desulfotignum phosphitoxidans DSM 13687]
MNNMRAIHPGEIIKEEYLEPLNMSANALAVALRVSAPRINDVIRQKRGVSIDTALRLARYFNTTPQFWMNLQISYDLKIAKQNMTKIENEIIPLQATTA